MYLLIYVDDIIIISSIPTANDELLQLLCLNFAVKDLGNLHYFLGVEVIPMKNGLHKTDMKDAKPVTSPMSSSSTLSAFTGDPMEDPSLYRSTVGSLQYLSHTRLDLVFAVNRACQFIHQPPKLHWEAVKRMLRYLKHTITHGLLLQKTHSTSLQAFSNVDWVGCPDGRKSTGIYCVFLGSNLIS